MFLSLVLKGRNGEYSVFVTLAAGAVTALLILKNLSRPISELQGKIAEYGIDAEYFKVAVKALGLGYVSSFIADTCRDSGHTSLASKAELAGKTAILITSLPLLNSVLEIAEGYIK